ncbi:MAG: TIM barrel protein, partial [Clostridia bacterium]|nr:TIM barrel protein [Clostridia bacterium]
MERVYNTAMFGPSGHDESYAKEGYTSTLQMPKWLRDKGLDLFEYSFGRGVRISSETAEAIGAEVDKYNIEMSVHAPYFINFASVEQQKADNSITYLTSSLKVLRHFHGSRCVFHSGAEGGQPRIEAFARTKDSFMRALAEIEALGLDDLIVCPETMGKQAQIGTIEEVIELCKLGNNVYPCIDFGHVNSLLQGALKTTDDFQRVVDKMFDGLGEIKTKNMHVHFSKIQYGAKGEIKHLTFADNIYGPEFEPFAEVIVKNSLTPHILSESAGTQMIDAKTMKSIYE